MAESNRHLHHLETVDVTGYYELHTNRPRFQGYQNEIDFRRETRGGSSNSRVSRHGRGGIHPRSSSNFYASPDGGHDPYEDQLIDRPSRGRRRHGAALHDSSRNDLETHGDVLRDSWDGITDGNNTYASSSSLLQAGASTGYQHDHQRGNHGRHIRIRGSQRRNLCSSARESPGDFRGNYDGPRQSQGNSLRGNRGARDSRGGYRQTQSSFQRENFVMSEQELEAYSQNTTEEILSYATQNEKAFLNAFKNKKYCTHPLRLKQLIKILYLLIESQSSNRQFVTVKLAKILNTENEDEGFVVAIERMLKGILKDRRNFVIRENVVCLQHLVKIGSVAVQSIPSTVLHSFPVPALEQAANDLRRLINIDNVFDEIQILKDAFEVEKETFIIKTIKDAASQGEPPEPFTDIPVLPTLEELTIMSKDVFLRPNIVSGSYNSWDHYFDIQFRLLREDFIRPLREGIAAYYYTRSSRGISDIRVYQGTRILNPVCLHSSGIGFEIKFNVSDFKGINWEHSRRLIFGSLLCLSNDNFSNHVMFATVVKRDPKLLKEGLLIIKFEDNTDPFSVNSSTVFTMVESTAYFEAYRYILERLQALSKIPDQMPMTSYILGTDYDDIKHVETPAFLNVPTKPIFDLSGIIEMKRAYSRTNLSFDVTDDTKWPYPRTTKLDSSQLEALKVSLSREMAVVQGPPGTGKTFIGLKIAKAYLNNRNVWDPKKSSPILVVCYTNHALDQFLEGILDCGLDDINIIRIGGRSKSKTLSNCLLREHVQKARAKRSIPGKLFGDFRDAQADLAECQRKIENNMKHCDAEAKNTIIQLSVLENCVSEFHTEQLLHDRPTEQDKEIEVWLGLWYPEETPQMPNNHHSDNSPHEIFESEESSDDDSYIDVDNEARLLEDDRMIDEELLHLLQSPPRKKAQPKVPQTEKITTDDSWSVIQLSEKKRNQLMQKGFSNMPMTDVEARRVHNIWNLSIEKRWQLYLYWMNKYTSQCKSQVSHVIQNYNEACKKYNQAQREIECFVAEKADVIGLTTTGAAKYHHLLDGLHPKIAIFEEAAEVLEAHLVTSIASSVQQVILIGDHKQLRPKPTCYKLEEDYKLGISLFERLVEPPINNDKPRQNDFPFVTLQVQHRMRPEISKLIYPSIYRTLRDAKNVGSYEHIRGITKDLFFVCHNKPEEDNSIGDSKSHVNKYEAEYVVQLCLYLLKQNYSPEDITILSMYQGQLLELRRRMKRKDFQGVRVAAVDDFQGEENEIIILSLVRSLSRSSSRNKIGFLQVQNRVCVSLSRARKGLYIIGNGHLLKERHDTKWPQIIKYLEEEKCYGKHLTLYCQNHQEDRKVIEEPKDFEDRPEGGCQRECGKRLSCGHTCPRICHIRDSKHEKVVCTRICGKPLYCGHECQSKCLYCKKNKECKPCKQRVEKILQCGHQIQADCSVDARSISCPMPCDKILPCQHKCMNLCSQPCSIKCRRKVEKKLPCGHSDEIECFRPAEAVCSQPCRASLKCGHVCTGTCGQCSNHGLQHVPCKEKCGRTLLCGHKCDSPCSELCPPCTKPCNNSCIHSKCPRKCHEPCEPCMEECNWNCPCCRCSKPCGELCDRPVCNKPCLKSLKCGHPCIGLCGENCPTKCRFCDKDELCNFTSEEDEETRYIQLQDCGHIFEVNAFDGWMRADTTESTTEREMIKFKSCPNCKVPIRNSFRYRNNIKEVLLAMNSFKEEQLRESTFLTDKKENKQTY